VDFLHERKVHVVLHAHAGLHLFRVFRLLPRELVARKAHDCELVTIALGKGYQLLVPELGLASGGSHVHDKSGLASQRLQLEWRALGVVAR